jgi:hypothetical protein
LPHKRDGPAPQGTTPSPKEGQNRSLLLPLPEIPRKPAPLPSAARDLPPKTTDHRQRRQDRPQRAAGRSWRAFSVRLVAEPGVDAIKSFRALLKVALRRFGLRAIDVRECALTHREDERALAPAMEASMSAFSERIRSQRDKGLYKVADFEAGEKTHTISHLDEEMELYGKTMDILNFVDTGRQLQINQTNAEFLLENFGDDPATYAGKRVTLGLADYEYKGEVKKGIRLKLPDAAAAGDGAVPTRPGRSDMDDEIPW